MSSSILFNLVAPSFTGIKQFWEQKIAMLRNYYMESKGNKIITLATLFFFFSFFSCTQKDDSLTIQSIVEDYYVFCDQGEFDAIYANWKEDHYIPIKIVHNGDTISDAKIRLRGDTSRKEKKKSLKIKFQKKTFKGHGNVINFNAEFTDKSYIRQYLSSRIYRETGQPCYKTKYVRIHLNGAFYGLYLLVENVDNKFLKRNNLDTQGNLYKAKKDGACLSIFDDLKKNWEKKTNTMEVNEDLRQLIDSINNVPISRFKAFCENTFDYDNLINMISLNIMLANGSTYYHNYYLYHDIHSSGKWMLFPWDMDKSLSYYNWMPYTYHRTSSEWESDNPLVEKVFISPETFTDVKKRIEQLTQTFINNDFADPIIDELVQLIEPSVAEDETDEIDGVETWKKTIEAEKAFFRDHYNSVLQQFNNLPSSFLVNRIDDPVSCDIQISWLPSKSPLERDITYQLYYSRNFLLKPEETTVVKDIKAESYVLKGLEDGTYYWKIMAYDGEYLVDGFNTKNILKVRTLSGLPEIIDHDLVLTKENSPYLVDKKVTLLPNVTITIQAGVKVIFRDSVDIIVNGCLNIFGTEQDPVILKPELGSKYWGWIYIDRPTSKCIISNAKIIEGKLCSKHADLLVENTDFIINKKRLVFGEVRHSIIWVHKGSIVYRNNRMYGNGTGEGININFASSVVENSYFTNTPDAIEFIDIDEGRISNNRVENSPDDAIDLNGCNNILINNNTLINNKDKGISIGTEQYGASRNIRIESNIIANNSTGIAVKDSSDFIAINNTLYNNKTGITAYRKRQNYDVGGTGIVYNTIISNSRDHAFRIDDYSSLQFINCLSDSVQLPGKENSLGNPSFVSPRLLNFNLSEGSACIGKANTEVSLKNGTILKDIGALPISSCKLLINEIYYWSGKKDEIPDWIELYNAGNSELDLSGWKLCKEKGKNYYFPDKTIIPTGEYLVISTNPKRLMDHFPGCKSVCSRKLLFGLGKKAETLRLFSSDDQLVLELQYKNGESWPNITSVKSIQLIRGSQDGNDPSNWKMSDNEGSPGKQN